MLVLRMGEVRREGALSVQESGKGEAEKDWLAVGRKRARREQKGKGLLTGRSVGGMDGDSPKGKKGG